MSAYDPYYEQCDGCKRLVTIYPMANSVGATPELTLINTQRLCWECTEKAIAARGMVPPKPSLEEQQRKIAAKYS